MAKSRVLISDNLAQEGIAVLEDCDQLEVIAKTSMEKSELEDAIADVHGLVIRSATKVTADILEKAKNLKVIARAGVGVDNVDIPAASKKGIVVMNAPGGNTISTAEHAISMILSLSRHIPQASASMKEGKWEKKLFQGSEITGKTLGVVGLGRIGKEVAKRATGLQMNVIGFDPYMPVEKLTHLDLEIVSLEELLSRSDLITVHTPLNDQTRDLINEGNLSVLKKGVRLINCARGGIYNENALLTGLNEGILSGVALDVFVEEPPKLKELIEHPKCICTPHLGASTSEAQKSVAIETAQEVVDFLTKGIARNSLNFPTIDPNDMKYLAPWYSLSEYLGVVVARMNKGKIPKSVNVEYHGNFEDRDLSPLQAPLLKGIVDSILAEPANYVNAPMIAKDYGLRFSSESISGEKKDLYSSYIKINTLSEDHSFQIRGSVINGIPHIISIEGLILEVRLEGVLLFIRNRDIPNMVGTIGTFLGQKNINIARLELSRQKEKESAITAIALDSMLDEQSLKELGAKEGILDIFQVEFH